MSPRAVPRSPSSARTSAMAGSRSTAIPARPKALPRRALEEAPHERHELRRAPGARPATVRVGEHRPDRGADSRHRRGRRGARASPASVTGPHRDEDVEAVPAERPSTAAPERGPRDLLAPDRRRIIGVLAYHRWRPLGNGLSSAPMKILYGVVGEGMGHAMRSRVILEHLRRAGARRRDHGVGPRRRLPRASASRASTASTAST